MRRLGQLLLGCGLLAGCGQPEPAASVVARRALYFDVKGLVERQMEVLSRRGPAVAKRVTLRDGRPETVRVPSVKWANELQVFLQADINKSALRGAYTVDSVALPGGLTRRTYTRRLDLSHAPVTRLMVEESGGQPRQLRADITQLNPLFATNKQLLLEFQGGQLHRYGVSGTQKLVLFDTLRYSTLATVE